MTDIQSLRDSLEPVDYPPVRLLVSDAGVNVDDWTRNKAGEEIENPNANSFRNARWAFGGKGEPAVLFIWFRGVDWTATPPQYRGTPRLFSDELNSLSASASTGGEKIRIRGKLNKAAEAQNIVYESYAHHSPIRIVLVAGNEVSAADAAISSSKTNARRLDPVAWFVHAFDAYEGTYTLVRGLPPPMRLPSDPFEDAVDPVLDDPVFLRLLGELSDTEQDALIKIRVGQGYFRTSLIKRWQGCSVTGCEDTELLIASHIKPWSECVTRAERLGSANGLLLIPNLDKLFDQGAISFDDTLKIQISGHLKLQTQLKLNVNRNDRLRTDGGEDLLPFLKWHRENVFDKA